MKKTIIVVLSIVVVFAVGLGVGAFAVGKYFPGHSPGETAVEKSDTQVLQAVEREQQVVLLSLGIQGIRESRTSQQLFGVDIPGSGRLSLMQYTFTAKLGLEGGAVKVRELKQGGYLVTVPEFVFIGHDKPKFEIPIEKNGVLSWVTPEIEDVQVINEILDDEGQTRYIKEHMAVLEQQAAAFYSNIIHAIEPDAVIEFVFADGT